MSTPTNADQQLTFFLCIGVPKTGTTVLARVLDQHPEIACIWESYVFHPRSRASLFNPQSDSWRRHGFDQERVEAWAAIWRQQPQLAARRVVRKLTGRTVLARAPFQRTMPEALADFARRCNARVVGDKWPWYIHYLDHVLAAMPQVRLIYSVRDPRGLWNSAQRFKQRQRGDEILAQMLAGDRQVTRFQQQSNFLTVRYEDLVGQPEATVRRLVRFLGCEFDPGYLEYRQEKDPYPARWDWIPEAGVQLNPWHATKWQEQLSPAEIDRVTERSRRFMDKYGYD